jgi:hypothetical protein
MAHLAAGNASAAWEAFDAARQHFGMTQTSSTYNWAALAPLACGDLVAARRWADDVVSATKGCYQTLSLAARARVEIAGELDGAERDAYDALDLLGGDLVVPLALDCLAIVAGYAGNHLSAARLFGAADVARQQLGMLRLKVLEADDEARIVAAREALGQKDFDAAWAEGAELSLEEAIAYARRGRGARKRPTVRLGIPHPDGARPCAARETGTGQQGNRREAFRLTPHRADPLHPRLHQTRAHLARPVRPRSGPGTPDCLVTAQDHRPERAYCRVPIPVDTRGARALLAIR